jgi:hypothetical protein
MPIFDFIIEISTTPELFNIKGNNPRFFKRIVLHDSINTFPTAELIVPNNSNIFLENYFPIEGVGITLKFGNGDFKYLTPELFFSNNELLKIVKETYISGDLFIKLWSKFIIDNRESKSKSFNDEISNIITNILGKYSYLTPKITSTENKDFWYQGNLSDWEFFKTMWARSYTSSYEYSPFLMFINLHNEFIFKPIKELFEQTSIGTYILDNSETAIYNRNNILSYNLTNQGYSSNKNKYNIALQTDEGDTTLTIEKNKIENFLRSSNASKSDVAPILAELQDTITEYAYYGLNFDDNPNNSKGFRNFKNLETSFPLQIEITVFFNREAVAGKLITINTSTQDSSKPSKTYTDDWLIIESNHFYDIDGIAYSTLALGRNTIELPKDHPLASKAIKKL